MEEAMEEAKSQSKLSRREEILDVYLDLFLRKGYESTPVHEIAEKIGTSHSNVHYHFKHKVEILRRLFEPSFSCIELLLQQQIEDQHQVLEEYLGIMLEQRKLAALLATDLSVQSVPDIRRRAHALMDGLRKKIAGDNADPEEEMRVECALGVLRSGVVSFPEADADTVRNVTLPAARAVLMS